MFDFTFGSKKTFEWQMKGENDRGERWKIVEMSEDDSKRRMFASDGSWMLIMALWCYFLEIIQPKMIHWEHTNWSSTTFYMHALHEEMMIVLHHIYPFPLSAWSF